MKVFKTLFSCSEFNIRPNYTQKENILDAESEDSETNFQTTEPLPSLEKRPLSDPHCFPVKRHKHEDEPLALPAGMVCLHEVLAAAPTELSHVVLPVLPERISQDTKNNSRRYNEAIFQSTSTTSGTDSESSFEHTPTRSEQTCESGSATIVNIEESGTENCENNLEDFICIYGSRRRNPLLKGWGLKEDETYSECLISRIDNSGLGVLTEGDIRVKSNYLFQNIRVAIKDSNRYRFSPKETTKRVLGISADIHLFDYVQCKDKEEDGLKFKEMLTIEKLQRCFKHRTDATKPFKIPVSALRKLWQECQPRV
jgi:hypothetical protein